MTRFSIFDLLLMKYWFEISKMLNVIYILLQFYTTFWEHFWSYMFITGIFSPHLAYKHAGKLEEHRLYALTS